MIKVIKESSWSLNNIQLESRKKFIEWINSTNKLNYIQECPFCGGIEFKQLSDVDRFGLNFEANQCQNCNLVFTNPQIKEEFLPEYYNVFYHPLIFGTEQVLNFLFDSNQGQKIYSLISKYIKKNSLDVFEIGAGSAGNLIGFQEIALNNNIKCNLEGLELSERYIEYAKTLNITLYSDQLKDYIEKVNKTYDVIILSHVLEHVNNLNNFLQDVKKLMHPKTLLYIEVPGILNLHNNNAYKCNFKNYLVHAHMYHFTAETLEKVLLANGLFPLQINEGVEAVVQLNSGENVLPKCSSNIEKYLYNLERNKKICLVKNFAITIFARILKKAQKIIK